MGSAPATCPECEQSWEPQPFYAERRSLYGHLRAVHAWSPDQVNELKGKAKATNRARPTGKVSRPPASPKAGAPEAPMTGTDFARRVKRMGELQPRIAQTGNILVLQGVLMLGWFPPPLLVEFRSEPQTGMPLPQWDKPTDFGRAVMLDDREAMVYAAAWAFSEGTPVMGWLEDRIGTIAPVVVALAAAAVTFRHLRTVRALANSPQVVAFKDQYAAALAEVQRQAQAPQEG